ncbi:hypothetical protein Enr17x_15740 [Gimesia fumaroli]|uniref:Uncharacterized protein n=2 Tax=Gimesia fumaroli TaxID=2527976 RepID=A0A518I917_9PLAN|nr:hypothetical protein Enr17x_15740 [Gimesia fumaroli]
MISNSDPYLINGQSFAIKMRDITADDLVADAIHLKAAMESLRQASIDSLAQELADSVDRFFSLEDRPITFIEFPEPGPIRFRVCAYLGPFI